MHSNFASIARRPTGCARHPKRPSSARHYFGLDLLLFASLCGNNFSQQPACPASRTDRQTDRQTDRRTVGQSASQTEDFDGRRNKCANRQPNERSNCARTNKLELASFTLDNIALQQQRKRPCATLASGCLFAPPELEGGARERERQIYLYTKVYINFVPFRRRTKSIVALGLDCEPWAALWGLAWLFGIATGRWLLAAGYWPLATGHWPLATGHWPLATGHWPLATRRWPLVVVVE